ncbi:MAG: hypothetical protein ACP5M4_12225 [Acidobacteriaceae bacterium]
MGNPSKYCKTRKGVHPGCLCRTVKCECEWNTQGSSLDKELRQQIAKVILMDEIHDNWLQAKTPNAWNEREALKAMKAG